MSEPPARARARHALLLLVAALAALSFAYGPGWPDISRLGLTESIALQGTLRIDRYARQTQDRADHGGHSYSDKAPGNSFLALPSFEALRAVGLIGPRERDAGAWRNRGLLWLLRVLTGGIGFVALLLLVAFAAERLAAGTGVLAALTLGLATMAMPLAATTFSHLAAGALAFAGFLLAWRRRTTTTAAAAGACAAAAVLFEYTLALASLAVLVYLVAARRDVRAVLAYLVGAVPCVVALGAYNAAAFGSPFHFSYRYEVQTSEQQRGLFGIHTPTADGLWQVLVGHRGLFLVSPVLLLALAGLVLLWRGGQRKEAALAIGISGGLVLLAAGYFDPYGGLSPGPRYMAAALPFLALGLADAYTRWPRATAALAAVSIAATLFQAGTWGPNVDWSTVWWWIGVPRPLGMAFVVALVAAAGGLAAPDIAVLARRAPAGRAPARRKGLYG